jgi:lipid II:glycine glycyltransferase (peptidoglycan interpeptide bridge formation enzyme)
MNATGTRNEFGVHAPSYYATAYREFAARGAVALLLAEYEGRPLAGSMIFRSGRRASYLYGGSNDEERQRMPSYAVQWAAMQWARAQGCDEYDLWGVPDQDADELEAGFQSREDGLWPVYRFKRGFQGNIRRTVGTADRVYNKLLYRLYQRRRGGGGL